MNNQNILDVVMKYIHRVAMEKTTNKRGKNSKDCWEDVVGELP